MLSRLDYLLGRCVTDFQKTTDLVLLLFILFSYLILYLLLLLLILQLEFQFLTLDLHLLAIFLAIGDSIPLSDFIYRIL